LRTQTTSKRKPRAATAYRTKAITVHTWGRLNTKIAHTTAMHANIYSFADVIGKSGYWQKRRITSIGKVNQSASA